jgi:hypothetical protein
MSMKRSALFHLHQRAGAKFVEHQGWELPSSFHLPEHEATEVRRNAGLADLSHQLKFDLQKQPHQKGWCLGANHYLMMGEAFVWPARAAETSSTSCHL